MADVFGLRCRVVADPVTGTPLAAPVTGTPLVVPIGRHAPSTAAAGPAA